MFLKFPVEELKQKTQEHIYILHIPIKLIYSSVILIIPYFLSTSLSIISRS